MKTYRCGRMEIYSATSGTQSKNELLWALNMKNFIKRLRRRGIVGMDEEVKLER